MSKCMYDRNTSSKQDIKVTYLTVAGLKSTILATPPSLVQFHLSLIKLGFPQKI
jgi:hypothetical protein